MITTLWALATAAWAHARLVHSDPADGAVLETPPATVALRFDGEVEREFHRFELFAGSSVDDPVRLEGAADPTDATRVSIRMPAMLPGSWRVRYEVVSRDGHRVTGSVRFQIR